MTIDTYSNSKFAMWEILQHLMQKYVCLSGEYVMLKEKWSFLEFTNSPALPLKANSLVFKAVDDSLSRLDVLFSSFNLSRSKQDSYSDFSEANLSVYEKIKEEFFYLVSYIGLLKLAYSQRTTCLEMSHVVTGFPQSPEKTIGSGLIFVAADKVAEAYGVCIKPPMLPPHNITPAFQWDEFVSFVPPLTTSTFYGAFCKISPYGIYHLSLSEEQKPSISSLLILAHEVGHVPAFDPSQDTNMRKEYIQLAEYLSNKTISTLLTLEETGTITRWYKCRNCPWDPTNWLDVPRLFMQLYEQVFADIIGYKIGGPMTVEALMDETLPAEEAIVRSEIVCSYMEDKGSPQASDVDNRIDCTLQQRKDFLCNIEGKPQDHPVVARCSFCLKTLGKTMGFAINDYESNHPNFFPKLVKSNKEFSISLTEEEKIVGSLSKGIPCPDVDVRKILHVYRKAFKSGQLTSKPHYSATLHSIAFNNL